jgi:hypothetical protein
MKGLAIYTIVLYGVFILGALSDISREYIIGMIALLPIFIFAILYLIKDNRRRAYENKQVSSTTGS